MASGATGTEPGPVAWKPTLSSGTLLKVQGGGGQEACSLAVAENHMKVSSSGLCDRVVLGSARAPYYLEGLELREREKVCILSGFTSLLLKGRCDVESTGSALSRLLSGTTGLQSEAW